MSLLMTITAECHCPQVLFTGHNVTSHSARARRLTSCELSRDGTRPNLSSQPGDSRTLSACATQGADARAPAHRAASCADLLQRPLDVDALTPRRRRVGQALAGVAAARDVDALPPEVLEGRRHDGDAVVGQSARVLWEGKGGSIIVF